MPGMRVLWKKFEEKIPKITNKFLTIWDRKLICTSEYNLFYWSFRKFFFEEVRGLFWKLLLLSIFGNNVSYGNLLIAVNYNPILFIFGKAINKWLCVIVKKLSNFSKKRIQHFFIKRISFFRVAVGVPIIFILTWLIKVFKNPHQRLGK